MIGWLGHAAGKEFNPTKSIEENRFLRGASTFAFQRIMIMIYYMV
jgi:hypothetical protein